MIPSPFGLKQRNFINNIEYMIIYLIGFMGSGKTYMGKILSQHMNVPHVDLDEWIVESSGKTIASIFETEGEEKFRKKETNALVEIKENLISRRHP